MRDRRRGRPAADFTDRRRLDAEFLIVEAERNDFQDWQAVLDLVVEKGWKYQYSEGETVLPMPRAEAVLSRPADAECPGPAGLAGCRCVGDLPYSCRR
jgi:hypothetical protein